MNKNPVRDPLLPLAKVCISLLVLLVVAIFIYRELGLHKQPTDNSEVIASRNLHFYDTAKGQILITDENGMEISVVGGEGGFMRAVLRSLAKERIAKGVGPEKPFKLQANQNGIVTITDPVTGSKVDVSSFGKTNSEIFTILLPSLENTIHKEEG